MQEQHGNELVPATEAFRVLVAFAGVDDGIELGRKDRVVYDLRKKTRTFHRSIAPDGGGIFG